LIPAAIPARAVPTPERAGPVPVVSKESHVHLVLSILAAVVPALLLLWYFYARDVYREPRRVVLLTFLLGIVVIFPVVGIENWLGNWYVTTRSVMTANGVQVINPLFLSLFTAFVIAALTEELFKFLVVRFYSARRRAFDEPMDGIVYGATASLGFALLENVMYVLAGGWHVALLRAFTAVPAHAAWGAILGYHVGQAKFGAAKRGMMFRGFFFAWLLHGLYDFPLLYLNQLADTPLGNNLLLPLAGGALAVFLFAVIWALLLVRRLRAQQLALQPAV
jgi:RsiW-degrading membrane proteinase PrsW (M82 family)